MTTTERTYVEARLIMDVQKRLPTAVYNARQLRPYWNKFETKAGIMFWMAMNDFEPHAGTAAAWLSEHWMMYYKRIIHSIVPKTIRETNDEVLDIMAQSDDLAMQHVLVNAYQELSTPEDKRTWKL